ncbi:hypothetical protein HOA92_01470 [archaeon]|nr:hypothetical protein [archaeon]MBT6761684.1 hypothetical protein [archaeon]
MNTYSGLDNRPVEEIIRDCKYPYQRMANDLSSMVGNSLDNKYVQAGLVGTVGAAALVAAGPAYAGEVAAGVEYGFFSGAWDGFLVGPNIIMDLVGCESTWAADGAGVRSTPNTGLGYWIGFYLMAGTEGTIFGVIGGSGD